MSRHELWVELADEPGNLARLAGDLAACGANVVDIEVRAGAEGTVLDRIVVDVPDGRERALEVVATRYLASCREVDPSSAA
jgi:ACT domain-containing protein